MDKVEKEKVKRDKNANLNKEHLITAELQNKAKKQALEKRKSVFNLNAQKKTLITLFCSLLGVAIVGIVLFVLTGKPFTEKQSIKEPLIGTNYSAETDSQSVNMDLFLHVVNSSLKAALAISTNDFEMLKTVIVSDATIDETNQTVTFPLEIPFIMETKYFPPFSLGDLKVVGYEERGGVDPILIMRIEEHTYEVMFSKDEASNGEYRIFSFTGNR